MFKISPSCLSYPRNCFIMLLGRVSLGRKPPKKIMEPLDVIVAQKRKMKEEEEGGGDSQGNPSQLP